MNDEDKIVLIVLLRKYRDSYGSNLLTSMTAQAVHDDLIASLDTKILEQEGLLLPPRT